MFIFLLVILNVLWTSNGSPSSSNSKESAAVQETWVRSLGLEGLWRRAWQPTPVFLSGEFYGQRRLGCYSLWGCKELDTAKQLSLSLSSFCHFFYMSYGHLITTYEIQNFKYICVGYD